jgi:hypothetical protein
MIDPLKSLDRWASQSVDRSTFLMWLLVVALGFFVALAIAGEVWYSAPAAHHVSQTSDGPSSG